RRPDPVLGLFMFLISLLGARLSDAQHDKLARAIRQDSVEREPAIGIALYSIAVDGPSSPVPAGVVGQYVDAIARVGLIRIADFYGQWQCRASGRRGDDVPTDRLAGTEDYADVPVVARERVSGS